MRTALMVTTVLALCACTPAPSSTSAAQHTETTTIASATPAPAANGCPARATSMWDAGGGNTYSMEATAAGATCAEAQATLIIRDAHGALEQSLTVGAADTRVLGGAESVPDMQRRLGEWITPAGATADSTGDLPIWEAGAEAPSADGPSFAPTSGMAREEYQALRAQDEPMYCYETSRTGGECFAIHNGSLTQIGVQSYASE